MEVVSVSLSTKLDMTANRLPVTTPPSPTYSSLELIHIETHAGRRFTLDKPGAHLDPHLVPSAVCIDLIFIFIFAQCLSTCSRMGASPPLSIACDVQSVYEHLLLITNSVHC